MIQTVLTIDKASFEWLDVTAPTGEELAMIAKRFNIHHTLIEDCLDPEHLPKFEKTESTGFMIVRTFDPTSPLQADTVQDLTRKIAMFFNGHFFITIHRVALPLIDRLSEDWGKWANKETRALQVVFDCLNRVVESYETPLDRAENEYENFERALFANQEVIPQLKAIHQVKQQLAVYRRLLFHTLNSTQRIQVTSPQEISLLQDLRENTEASYVYVDDLMESLDALVHTQLAIASHRTNEIVRLLTLFSVFFLPLTFIAGIYGMNFRHMPELDSVWGYPAILLLMFAISLGIFIWFRKKGFFK